MFCISFSSLKRAMSRIKLHGREPYFGPKVQWNYRSQLLNQYSRKAIRVLLRVLLCVIYGLFERHDEA